jgi:hypothetical protein
METSVNEFREPALFADGVGAIKATLDFCSVRDAPHPDLIVLCLLSKDRDQSIHRTEVEFTGIDLISE